MADESKTKKYDITLDSLTYLASIIGTIILVLILGFCLRYGVRHLSFNFILGTFDAQPTWVKFEGKAEETFHALMIYPRMSIGPTDGGSVSSRKKIEVIKMWSSSNTSIKIPL